jgi:hypothetical protein
MVGFYLLIDHQQQGFTKKNNVKGQYGSIQQTHLVASVMAAVA